jgi:hypothetical protein
MCASDTVIKIINNKTIWTILWLER